MSISSERRFFIEFIKSTQIQFPTVNIPSYSQEEVESSRDRRIATLNIFNLLESKGEYSLQRGDFNNLVTILQYAGLEEIANSFVLDTSSLSSMSDSITYRDGVECPEQRNICLYLLNEEIVSEIPIEQRILKYSDSRSYKKMLEKLGLEVDENHCRTDEQFLDGQQQFLEGLKRQRNHDYVIVVMLGYMHRNQQIDTVLMNGADKRLVSICITDIHHGLKKVYCKGKILFIQMTIPLPDNHPEIQFIRRQENFNQPRDFDHIHIHADNKQEMEQLLKPEFTELWVKSRDIPQTLQESIQKFDKVNLISLSMSLRKYIPKCPVIFKIIVNLEQTLPIESYYSGIFCTNETRCHCLIDCEKGELSRESWDKLKKITTDETGEHDLIVFLITSKCPVSNNFHYQIIEACNISMKDTPVNCPKIFIIDAPLANQKEQFHTPEIGENTLILGSCGDCSESAILRLAESLVEDKLGEIDLKSHVVRVIPKEEREYYESRLRCPIHLGQRKAGQ